MKRFVPFLWLLLVLDVREYPCACSSHPLGCWEFSLSGWLARLQVVMKFNPLLTGDDSPPRVSLLFPSYRESSLLKDHTPDVKTPWPLLSPPPLDILVLSEWYDGSPYFPVRGKLERLDINGSIRLRTWSPAIKQDVKTFLTMVNGDVKPLLQTISEIYFKMLRSVRK